MKLRVRYAETDQMGVAHHSVYPIWMEAARVEWLRERGMSYRDIEEQGISLAVAELTVRYRAAVKFDDELVIETRLTEAKRRRFEYRYQLYRPVDRVAVAVAKTTHVPTDRRGRAVRLPAHWLERLLPYLQEPF